MSSATKKIQINFDLEEGAMKEMVVGDGDKDKVLISKYAGKLYATGAFCSHYDVPLQGGVRAANKIICPAHSASFDLITGRSLSGPGRDGIPTFKIVTEGEKSFVIVPEEGID